jgi:hypothetical protein
VSNARLPRRSTFLARKKPTPQNNTRSTDISERKNCSNLRTVSAYYDSSTPGMSSARHPDDGTQVSRKSPTSGTSPPVGASHARPPRVASFLVRKKVAPQDETSPTAVSEQESSPAADQIAEDAAADATGKSPLRRIVENMSPRVRATPRFVGRRKFDSSFSGH